MVCLKIDSGLEISDLLARYPAHHKVEHSLSREEANNTFHERQLGKPSNRSQYLCIQNSRNKCFSVLSNNFSPTTLQAQDKVANMVVKGTRHSIGGSLRGRGMGVHWGRTVTSQATAANQRRSAASDARFEILPCPSKALPKYMRSVRGLVKPPLPCDLLQQKTNVSIDEN